MARTERSTKEIADRIDPTYFRRVHPIRRIRFWGSVGVCVLALTWIGIALARGDATIYANGHLVAAHALFEKDCAQCHLGSFGGVPDRNCRVCHDQGGHGKDESSRCARCHRDHRGADGLAFVADVHCNRCHTDHRDYVNMDSHLEFRAEPRDQFMRFSHERHLDPKLLEGPLRCDSCHVPDESGYGPIRFADHCARCHSEHLDDELPALTVPHGQQPDQLRHWVAAAYLRNMRADGSIAKREGLGTSEAPDWTGTLERRTAAALSGLLEPGRNRGCLVCHTLEDGRIKIPAVPTHWLTRARFDHRPHASQSCSACHEMETSRSAMDLRLPGIATCRECHRSGGASRRCVTCHGFHSHAPIK